MERVTYGKWVGMMWRNRHGDTAFPRISFHMLGVIFLSVDRVRKRHRIVSLYAYLPFKSSTTHLRSFHTDCPFSTVRTPFPKTSGHAFSYTWLDAIRSFRITTPTPPLAAHVCNKVQDTLLFRKKSQNMGHSVYITGIQCSRVFSKILFLRVVMLLLYGAIVYLSNFMDRHFVYSQYFVRFIYLCLHSLWRSAFSSFIDVILLLNMQKGYVAQ